VSEIHHACLSALARGELPAVNTADVRFWVICGHYNQTADVRFTPQRKHAVATSARPLSAKSALTALQQKSANPNLSVETRI
jgi:hypothetical protein